MTPEKKINATIAIAAGLGAALGIVFFATGRVKEAYSMGAAGAIVGGFWGAAKILGAR